MTDQVVHLSPEAHTAGKEFCRVHGLKMRDWVSGLILDAIAGRTAVNGNAVTIPKKPMRPENPEPTLPGDEPWSKPPFWAGGKS